MTDRLDLDARLARLLRDEVPTQVPERLIHATRERVAGSRQHVVIGPLGRRLPTPLVRQTGAAAAAIAVVVIGSVLLLSNRSGFSNGSQPSTSPTALASASPSPCPRGGGTCLGELQHGTYSSTSLVPTVRYTVPAGWTNTLDIRGELDIQLAAGGQYTYPDGLTFHDGISIFRRPVAESSTAKAPLAGVGRTANDLAQWLAGHVDLVASTPTSVTVGGASGFRLVLSVPQGTRTAPDHCTTDHREPRCVSLFLSDDPAATYGFGLVGPEVAVVYLLDLPSGDSVMVVIDDVDGIDQAALVAGATPIVNSLVFSP